MKWKVIVFLPRSDVVLIADSQVPPGVPLWRALNILSLLAPPVSVDEQGDFVPEARQYRANC